MKDKAKAESSSRLLQVAMIHIQIQFTRQMFKYMYARCLQPKYRTRSACASPLGAHVHLCISRHLLFRLPVFLRISSDFSVLGPSQPELQSDVQLIVRSVNEIPPPLNVCAFVVTNSLLRSKK